MSVDETAEAGYGLGVKLPNADLVVVERHKVLDYLLNVSHPDGAGKARFFFALGFSLENWQDLAESLRRHAQENSAVGVMESPYGKRYVVEGPLKTPGGRTPTVRSVWILERQVLRPRLVTAFPA